MNKPDSITLYEPVKLKLAIKSSLKDVKETLALVILFWESLEEHPSEIAYSQQILREEDGENKPKIIISEDLKNAVCSYLSNILVETDLTEETLITNINSNCLFDTQLEPLQVALELFFRLAEINFVNLKNNNEERSGKYRYAKKLSYSSNIDIVHSLISINIDSFKRILLNWLGFKQISINEDHENSLKSLLTVFSENAIFELEKSNQKIKFNQNSIYKKLLETQESVDIGRKKESKGPLRILKSSLRDKINPYIWVAKTNEIEITSSVTTDQLKNYQERVDVSLHLSTPNKEYVKSEPVSLEFQAMH